MAKKSKPAKRVQTRKVNKKPAFLKAYIASASITVAAAAVGMDRSNHYDWLDSDPKYREAFAAAEMQAGQTLEDDAVRWARVGVFEPNVFRGRFQYVQIPVKMHELADGRIVRDDQLPEDKTAFEIKRSFVNWEDDLTRPLGVHRRSEGLMMRLLKRFMPDRYGEKVSAEVTGKGGGPVELEHRVVFVTPAPRNE